MEPRPSIMTVYGTRPEAIKVAPLIKALETDTRFNSIVVSTGQHRDMLEQINRGFSIFPDHQLEVMSQGQSLNSLVSLVLVGLDEILERSKPDVVVVQGDTSTAMAAAISAFNRGIQVVHVEAGLRTGDLYSPFPEEANRKIITQIAGLHLAPTIQAKKNLLREDVPAERIVVTGNTVIDAMLMASSWNVGFSDERLERIRNQAGRIVLVTTHRRENLSEIEQIGLAIRDLADTFPDDIFVLPLHRNPLVRNAMKELLSNSPNAIITEPLPYDEFTALLGRAYVVLTDSGGIQEEAPSLGKPVLVMRNNTERPEAVTAGTVKLVGAVRDRIFGETSRLMNDSAAYADMANSVNPYGDGKATPRIVAAISELLGVGKRTLDFA